MTQIEIIRGSVKDEISWPAEQVAELRRLFAEGRATSEIARHFGRSKWSVWGKLGRLGLLKRPRSQVFHCPRVEPVAVRVADHFGVMVLALRGPAQWRSVVWPRQVAMWLSIKAGRTYSATGRYFRRDHSTVMHAERKVELIRERDAEVRRLTDGLLKALLENAPVSVPAPAPAPEPEPPPPTEEDLAASDIPEAPYVAFYEATGACVSKNSRTYLKEQNARFAAAMRAALEGTP